jgi:hypothetical protein
VQFFKKHGNNARFNVGHLSLLDLLRHGVHRAFDALKRVEAVIMDRDRYNAVCPQNDGTGVVRARVKSVIDQGIAESLADYKEGRSYGPFETTEELITSLERNMEKRAAKKTVR